MTAPTTGEAKQSATAPEPRQFVQQLEATSSAAARAVGGFDDVWLRVAGTLVRLRFAGPALARTVIPAFAHLRTEARARERLTVHLWDSESTGVAMPAPPWDPAANRAYGEIAELRSGGLYGTVHRPTNALSVLDIGARRAFYWVRSASQLAHLEGVPPLLDVLHMWLKQQRTHLVHAAAIGRPGGCVLVAGRNGSGKSFTTLACMLAGLGVLGDDYCAVGPGVQPSVWSLYSTSKAHVDVLEQMPALATMVNGSNRPASGKALLLLHELRSHQIITCAPLKGLLIPHITGLRHSSVREASAAEGFAALAPSTIMQLPANSQTTLTRLGEIVRGVRCHHLDAGTDPGGLAGAVKSVLAT